MSADRGPARRNSASSSSRRWSARQFGISSNPIREALQQLQGEGFVVISPNKGRPSG
ncbi:GntR family transcriptional regulator [Rhizobium binxianense]